MVAAAKASMVLGAVPMVAPVLATPLEAVATVSMADLRSLAVRTLMTSMPDPKIALMRVYPLSTVAQYYHRKVEIEWKYSNINKQIIELLSRFYRSFTVFR